MVSLQMHPILALSPNAPLILNHGDISQYHISRLPGCCITRNTFVLQPDEMSFGLPSPQANEPLSHPSLTGQDKLHPRHLFISKDLSTNTVGYLRNANMAAYMVPQRRLLMGY